MENSNLFEQATQAQLKKLMDLGYQGDLTNLTKAEASDIISDLLSQMGGGQPYGNYNKQPQYGNYNGSSVQPPKSQPKQEQVQNQVSNVNPVKGNNMIDYSIQTRTGETLTLDPQTVDSYVCKDLTPTEFNYFFSVCKTYELNPFLKDIYAIKFGNQPATFIIDYKVMQQAADNSPVFDGLKVGVVYLDKNGIPQERDGAYILPGETLIAGWCDVFRKDRTHANRTYALYSENVKYNNKGEINTNWANKPVFMCVKVAKAQALRETFPNMFSNNTYTVDEMTEFDESNVIDAEVKNKNNTEVKEEQKKKTASKKAAPDSEEWLNDND